MYSKLLSIISFVTICGSVSHPWIGEPSLQPFSKPNHDLLVFQTKLRKDDIKVIFLGDSLTWAWLLDANQLWYKYYAPKHAYNYGVSGDGTENVLWRLENGEFDGLDSKLVVLNIGTNNLNRYNEWDISKGIREVLDQILRRQPHDRILLLGILPRGESYLVKKIQNINLLISKYNDDKRVFYLDMSTHFQNEPGVIKQDLYLLDKLHLNIQGYQVWHDAMEPMFSKLYNMSITQPLY